MIQRSQLTVRIGGALVACALVLGILVFGAAPAFAEHGGRPLSADLLGSNERPILGDPDGSGHAAITLNQGQGEVCFAITVTGVAPIAAAHIHKAPAGSPGGVVVNFNIPANGLSGCVAGVDPALIKDIRQNPGEYYVNVHNADFPGGALRGQLSK